MKNFIYAVCISFGLLCCKSKSNTVLPVNNNLKADTLRYLALGDSYTYGQSVNTDATFPAQLMARLSDTLKTAANTLNIIARTGWTTSDLLAATASQQPAHNYKLVTLLIGVNNQYQHLAYDIYVSEFKILLQQAVQFAGNDKKRVIVVSIPDYGYTPFGKSNQAGISAEIDTYNATAKQVCDSMLITYINITPVSRRGLNEPSLVAGDGLHPSADQYKLWVDAMLPVAIQKLR